jgi:histidinol-phosphate aminotransferase
MRANSDKIISTRGSLTEKLDLLGFFVCHSESNFLWVRPPEGLKAADLFAKLKEYNIIVRYFSDPKINKYIRISVGTDEEVAALLSAIDRIMKG